MGIVIVGIDTTIPLGYYVGSYTNESSGGTMLTCTTREPNPWSSCRFEQEANEPEYHCAFCDCVEVAEEGDFCSEACEAEAAAEEAAELASDLARGC